MSLNSVTVVVDNPPPDTVSTCEMVFYDSHTENTTIKEEEETRLNNCIVCYRVITNYDNVPSKSLPVEILCKTLKIPKTIISNEKVLEATRDHYCFECLDKVKQAASILEEIENLEKLLAELGSFFKNKIITTFEQSKMEDYDPTNEVRKSFVQCWKGWTVPISLSESSLVTKQNKKIVNVLNSTNQFDQEIDSGISMKDIPSVSVSLVSYEPELHDDPVCDINDPDDSQISSYDQQENKPPTPVCSLRPRRAVKRKNWKHSLSESEDSDNNGAKGKKRQKKSNQKYSSNIACSDGDCQEEFIEEKKVGRAKSGKSQSNLHKLSSVSHTKKQYTCNNCHRTFSTLLARNGHIKKKHQGDSKPYECDDCNRKFEKPSKLFAHQKRWHSTQQPKSESENKDESSDPVGGCAFACSECRMMFKSEESRQAHVLRFHKGVKRPYKCSVCDKNFRFKVHLDVHMELHVTSAQFPCNECDKEFISERKLRVHMANVHFRPFKCEICSRSFAKVYLLESHMYKHTGQKRFICEICGYSYPSNKRLQVHLQRHASGVEIKEPFQCEQCGKVFSEPQSLSSHIMSIHEKKFRFHCEVCGQGCQMLSMLKRHMLCHTEEKMFSCDICVDKKFKRKPQLVQHMLIHENKFPYVCRHCGKGFRASEKLKNHERLHTGEKPYACHVPGCDKKFALKHYLTNHINIGHKGMKQQKRPKAVTDGIQPKGHSTRRVKPILKQTATEVVISILGDEMQVFQKTNQETLPMTDLSQEQQLVSTPTTTETEIAVNSVTISNNNSVMITSDPSYDPTDPNYEWLQFGFINANSSDSGRDNRRTAESEPIVVSPAPGFKVDDNFHTTS